MHFEKVRGDAFLQLAFGFQDERGPAMFVFKITVCNILSILTTLMHCILSWRCFYSWILVFKASVAVMQASADVQTWEVLAAMCSVGMLHEHRVQLHCNLQYLVCAGFKQYSR